MEEVITSVLERYNQYRIDDLLNKSFKNGGLTLNQISILYEHAEKRRLDEFKLLGKMLGAEFSDDSEEETTKKKEITEDQNQGVPLFKDPEDYKHMSKEERKKLTQDMMQKHRNWAGDWGN